MKLIKIVSLLVIGLVSAVSVVHAQELIDRFESDEELSHGTVVTRDGSTVKPASIGSDFTLLGVVQAEDSKQLFSISNDGRQLDVVTSGVTDILVSDENGPIEPGEQLAPSSLDGVATKAGGQAVLLGAALGGFDGSEPLTTVTLNETNQTVNIGRIPIRVDILQRNIGQGGTDLPEFVQDYANKIAGRPVAPIRAVSSMLVVAGTLLLAVSLFITLETGAHDLKRRNPSANEAVSKSQAQLVVIVFGVVVVGLTLAYLLLRTA